MARKSLLTEGEIRRFMKLAKMAPPGDSRINEMGYGYPGARDEADPEALEDYAADDLERGHPGEAMADEEEAGDELDDVEGGEDEEELLARVVRAVADELGVEATIEGGEEEDVEVEDELDLEEPGGEEELEVSDEEEIPMMERARRRKVREGTTKGEKTEKGELAYEDPSKGEEDEPEEGPEAESPGYRPKAYGQKSSVNEDSGEDEGAHYARNRDADDAHIEAIEHHLSALKHDRDYDEGHVDEGKRQDAIVSEVARRVAARLAKQDQKDAMAEQLAERIMSRLVKK